MELYSELWSSLYDLKLSSDKLWESLNKTDLEKFGKQLQITDLKINKSSLLIEENNARELRQVMNNFWDFYIGKGDLYKLRELQKNRSLYKKVTSNMIRNAISNNRQIKQRYDNLILGVT